MIIADNVNVTFHTKFFRKPIEALKNFTLKVSDGDIFGLLGPNGAGKSTAMYCMLGLIKPQKGNITVNGQQPVLGSSLFDDIAYLPEEPNYLTYLSVEEAVRYYSSLYLRGVTGDVINEVIAKVGLSEFADLKVSKCSKGMKQKVGLASCLVNYPKMVFLDEPTRGLDPIMVKEFRDILLDLKAGGSTIIINSHILSEMEMVCNRVAVMDRGEVLAIDDLDKLIKMDKEVYKVEFDKAGELPTYIMDVEHKEYTIRGVINHQDVQTFLSFAQKNNIKVQECSLKKISLEDAFFNILKEKKDD